MLYFSQLEWAELAPHKVTGKIFGWFRIPGPQRIICDGRPCPHLGSEVCRHHCPPDTGQLCAGHEAGKPLRPSRPSCPTHFQNLSCQKQPQPLAPQRVSSGACLEGPQSSFCGLVSCSHPGDVCSVCGSQSGPSRFPSRNPPTNFLLARLKCFPVSLPWLLLFPLPATLLPILSIGPILTPSQPCTRSSSVQALHNSAPTGTTPSHELTAFTACALH